MDELVDVFVWAGHFGFTDLEKEPAHAGRLFADGQPVAGCVDGKNLRGRADGYGECGVASVAVVCAVGFKGGVGGSAKGMDGVGGGGEYATEVEGAGCAGAGVV